MDPKISVITVVFNNVSSVEKTILSVVNQNYSNIEYVVIDGGSTDGTLDVIKKYGAKIRYWVSEKDKGIYDAMNKGLKASSGDYVIFINSGDMLVDNKVISKVFSLGSADVYYGETFLIDTEGKILGTRTDLTTRKLPKNMTWKDMKNGMVVSHQSIIVKRSIAPEYNISYHCSADIEWVIQSLKKAGKILNTNLVISKYLVGGFSISNQKRCWKERFKIYLDHYGVISTCLVHIKIILKNISYKISGKKNY